MGSASSGKKRILVFAYGFSTQFLAEKIPLNWIQVRNIYLVAYGGILGFVVLLSILYALHPPSRTEEFSHLKIPRALDLAAKPD